MAHALGLDIKGFKRIDHVALLKVLHLHNVL
jgi:hypothetical protein